MIIDYVAFGTGSLSVECVDKYINRSHGNY